LFFVCKTLRFLLRALAPRRLLLSSLQCILPHLLPLFGQFRSEQRRRTVSFCFATHTVLSPRVFRAIIAQAGLPPFCTCGCGRATARCRCRWCCRYRVQTHAPHAPGKLRKRETDEKSD
jgi:hypothetical protein